MQQIAHRGVHRNQPENSLAAFAAAVESGIDSVETDLRLAADGTIILFHDRLVGDRRVESLTRAELSQVIGYPVPTLAEALDAFPQVHWILELKTPEALESALPIIRPRVDSHHLMLISFWHTAIVEAASSIDIDLGFSLGNSSLGVLEAAGVARDRHPSINTLIWNYEFLDAEMLHQAQTASWRNLVFNTLSAADDMHCMALNVDGLITDRPGAAASFGESPTARGHH
jgi:glycerophosphoryl diester phosphodiesterase